MEHISERLYLENYARKTLELCSIHVNYIVNLYSCCGEKDS